MDFTQYIMSRENKIFRLFEAITQNTPDLIHVFDLNYKITYANDALLNMWGLTWEQSIGKKLSELGYEKWHAEMHQQEIDQVIATKQSIRGQVSFTHASMGKRFYDYIFVPVLDSYGNVEEISGITRDISDQLESSKIIEENEKRYSQLIHSSPSAIGIVNGPDFIITEANKPVLEIWGKGDEVVGKPYFEVLPELEEQGYKAIFAEIYQTGNPFNAIETPVKIVKDGKLTLKYYNFVLYPQKNADNEIVGIGMIASEVTSQTLMHLKVKESEERYRALADNLPMVSYIVEPNLEASVSYWNKTWLDYTGLTFEEALGRSWDSVIHPEDVDIALDIYRAAFKNRDSFVIPSIRVRRHDGEYRWHFFTGNPRFLQDGTLMG
ncbi:PAS domain S-box protein [Aquiflexum gelatinilyticum]|uniref:histidine kinase n=1 Tax=Aquiflexum gelatinilyticum TaxID=2961943 RepID=A0A9X2T0B4_9BACT|nr:PAS domain S-box protein [Aquiflexum gelatinilyticum]MCR9013700.1 PAS domain S-box protein [Aquiflexum gelatinilyticum]